MSEYALVISFLYSGVFGMALRCAWRLALNIGGTPYNTRWMPANPPTRDHQEVYTLRGAAESRGIPI
jgi:hypothetical protein